MRPAFRFQPLPLEARLTTEQGKSVDVADRRQLLQFAQQGVLPLVVQDRELAIALGVTLTTG